MTARARTEPLTNESVPHGSRNPHRTARPLLPAMRLMRHVSLPESTLRHVATRPLLPALATRCVRHRYSSTSAAYPERIAVLGGGVAGLSSAYFVSREFPKSKVTIFEAGPNAGGWMKSKKVKVPGGEVIFELGPRTLRNSTVTAHLVARPPTQLHHT
jgi:oxygen-dependent protoporphyrinogen oxidase